VDGVRASEASGWRRTDELPRESARTSFFLEAPPHAERMNGAPAGAQGSRFSFVKGSRKREQSAQWNN